MSNSPDRLRAAPGLAIACLIGLLSVAHADFRPPQRRWFVAAMNGSQARTVKVDLSFLDAGTYKGLIARDRADDPAAVDIETGDIVRGQALTMAMRPGGGFVMRLVKGTGPEF